MKIILGHTSDGSKRLSDYRKNGFGRMMVHMKFTPYEDEIWGLDNGAFICWRQGKQFDEKKFMSMVDYSVNQYPPYLAILPDIVAGGNESLDFSLSWIDRLPPYNWYLAVQDGMDSARLTVS